MCYKRLTTLFCSFLVSFSVFSQDLDFFFQKTQTFFETYVNDRGLVDYKSIKANYEGIQALMSSVEEVDIKSLDKATQQTFWINIYNLTAIYGITKRYPINSPLRIVGFFDKIKYRIAQEKLTLNEIEQKYLFKRYDDARLHFVLVCVAKGCPPLAPHAYLPNEIENQLSKRTMKAINDPYFVSVDTKQKKVKVSLLFRWYVNDFDKAGGIIPFINQYRTTKIPLDYKIEFDEYDWQLNDSNLKTNQNQPYSSSALFLKGGFELKMFNNLYTQTSFDGFEQLNSRSSYFSSFNQFLYGLNGKINIGFDVVYKSFIENDVATNSPFKTLKFEAFEPQLQISNQQDSLFTRSKTGLGWMAPKIRIAPFKKFRNVSIQQALYVPIQSKVENNFVSFTQIFYDRMLGTRTSLFVETSLWLSVAKDFSSAFPSPNIKAFVSYFPTNRVVLYGMLTPVEVGSGFKYYLTSNLELELLYTKYLPYAFNDGRRASTFNIGFRFFQN